MGVARALVAGSGCAPAWICRVSKDQCCSGVESAVMTQPLSGFQIGKTGIWTGGPCRPAMHQDPQNTTAARGWSTGGRR
ncbi:hypothetical protein GCM10007147_37660 [Nocardiopsis kunsanensis]|uniref:Uncharacterized protein n=1 Tax=Nocardiopsis kunsanensis TaxID=141693 RepID=A0A919CLA0_9ACTN|nr:hypothetical protein GCM10007147_37660 [Nocardiopsis kunsanensis]